jgi:D-alanyl-D-alanine carboxypeptidase-like protein
MQDEQYMTGISTFPDTAAAPLSPPHGLDEIAAAFGNIESFIRPDGQLDSRWQSDYLTSITLPFSLPLAWDPSQVVTRMACHRRLAAIFVQVFNQIQHAGLQGAVNTFGGCFAFRPQRTGSKLSTHSWGIAIDLNSGTNPQGSPGNMAAALIEIFQHAGFEWGGTWTGRTRDPMHFQFCTGY